MDPQQPPDPNVPPGPPADESAPTEPVALEPAAAEPVAPEPPAPEPVAAPADVPVPPAAAQPPSGPPPAAPPPAMPPATPPPAAAPQAAYAAAPAAWQQAPDMVGPAPGVRFAPHGGRLVAYIVDGLIVSVIIIAISIVLLAIFGGAAAAGGEDTVGAAAISGAFIWLFTILLVSVLYFPWFWARGGQTPGMRIFRLRVVKDADGSKIGWGTAILRYIGLALIDSIVFGIPIGLLWIFFDKRRRAWHDLIAGTCVIEQA